MNEVIAGEVVSVGFIDTRSKEGIPVYVKNATIMVMDPKGKKDVFQGLPMPYVDIETDEDSIGLWAYSGHGYADGSLVVLNGRFRVIHDPWIDPPGKPRLEWEFSKWLELYSGSYSTGVTITATEDGLLCDMGNGEYIPWSEIEAAREYFRGQESE